MTTSELFTVRSPADAWAHFSQSFAPTIQTGRIPVWEALDRVLAETLVAPHDLPEFARATVDGYAVNAADTFGATPGLPAFLQIVGEAPMGKAAQNLIGVGEAVLVHTGGMIPPGANAVVMVEQTQKVDEGSIEVLKPVAEGENVLQQGEDVRASEALFQPGHRLRAQDIGGLTALGIIEISVAVPPRVAIISSGDEVVPPNQQPQPGQVRDVNSYTLAALTVRAGGQPVRYPLVPDDRAALEAVAVQAKRETDIIVFSAGSSVSYRDLTLAVIEQLGAPGVLVHGVSVKPGKPTILAVCDGKPVIGLPGNPVSAMVVFELFVTPAIERLLGAVAPRRATVQAKLARNLASIPGREDFIPVRLQERAGELWATPVLGKSNLIYTLVHADGTVKIPLDVGGLHAGEWVTVQLG